MSKKVKIEIDGELDFDIEEGDMIIHIKHTGDIGKICMPEMNHKIQISKGYHKMLECLEVLQPGTRKKFDKHHEAKRKGTMH